jgi:hypothetical protein
MFSMIAVAHCLAGFFSIAAVVVEQGSADVTMLVDKARKLAYAVEIIILLDANASEALIVMDDPFFRRGMCDAASISFTSSLMAHASCAAPIQTPCNMALL